MEREVKKQNDHNADISKMDTIYRQAAIDAVDEGLTRVFFEHRDIAEKMINKIPSAQPPVLTCDGCRHVGTYDTDFPCSGCIRREKDYYESER